MSDSPTPYRVLARKYRPQNFRELIGQDAMVQTLGNAIKRGRLAHAFLMTGVRGVGKTSTARLIAKALNCVGPDGQGGPTIDPCGVCEPCQAIAEGRHIDVIEMDAASNTGVDDVREIIEAVRYAAVSARYKIYIVDEVHMLSKNAFNALLKTLEEPPAHVKFLFATTEVNKVPVTVLSRCQRFDLRRIPAELLAAHFAHVVEAEQVAAEPDALALVAQAAEGSARDGLSILDQAIAHAEMAPDSQGGDAAPLVTAAQVREMLGLSDRGSVRRLMGLLLEGETEPLLAAIREQYALGVEPLAVMRGLLELVHGITMIKAGRNLSNPAQSAEEREAIADWASQLGFAPLHRLWQLMLKGHDEVVAAILPIESCEMALLRVLHAGSMPDPGEIARMLREGGPPAAAAAGAAPAQRDTPSLPQNPQALIDLLWDRQKGRMADYLHDCAGIVTFAPPRIELDLKQPWSEGDFCRDLMQLLKAATGTEWQVTRASATAPSLMEIARQQLIDRRAAIEETPVVKAALESFPGAMLDDELVQWSAAK